MSVQAMIEAAKAERHYDGNVLVVVDARDSSGVRVEVALSSDGRGFSAYVVDGVGTGFSAYARDQLGAVRRALDGYLDILNRRG